MALAVSPFSLGVRTTAADHLRKHSSGSPTPIKSKPIINKSSSYDIVSRSNNSTFNSNRPKVVCSFRSLSNEQPRRSYSIQACTEAGAPIEDSPLLKKVWDFGHVWLKYLRPYAIVGTVAASVSVYGRVMTENPDLFRWSLLMKALPGLFAIICGNAYYIGINQIYDVDIDRVNKPYLPIASGELSMKSAWLLAIFYLVAGLLIVGLNAEPLVTGLYCLALFFGTIYSVPPLRLKRFSISTALVLSSIRGVLINIGVYYATRKTTLGLTFMWSPALVFITTFITLLFMVVAITKDITDIEGDTKFQIVTFAAKFGVRNIALFGTGILLLNYIGAILVPICMPQAFNRNFMVSTHAILALWLLLQAWILEQGKYTKEACANFYQVIWKLLYAEYIIYPFI
ncbi:homogentisate solanesyltransferase, chloroplastic-like [Humulus lupulus]|uniref:homogentisate solanesyltransferase, chloroplastic-like n=1 Tax=Humulus lupulus TaxID=3486 RepID=UPI002B4052F3|nr:homogentisate solanesyltransferase, chloroplastic-like [Humulus lupulus]